MLPGGSIIYSGQDQSSSFPSNNAIGSSSYRPSRISCLDCLLQHNWVLNSSRYNAGSSRCVFLATLLVLLPLASRGHTIHRDKAEILDSKPLSADTFLVASGVMDASWLSTCWAQKIRNNSSYYSFFVAHKVAQSPHSMIVYKKIAEGLKYCLFGNHHSRWGC